MTTPIAGPLSPDITRMLDAAREAVSLACEVCRHVASRIGDLRSMTKDDRSPVTVADFAAQAVVARTLRERLGTLRMVAEESSDYLRDPAHVRHLEAAVEAAGRVWKGVAADELLATIDSGRVTERPGPEAAAGTAIAHPDHVPFWVLDPVDGTKGFIRGEQYCVCLARIERGVPVIGILGCPNLPAAGDQPLDRADPIGSLYYAVAGHGAFGYAGTAKAPASGETPRRLRCPDVEDGKPFAAAESRDPSHTDHSSSGRLLAAAAPTLPPQRLDSQCKYAVVARGQAQAYLRPHTGRTEKIWDHAPGVLLAIEAGCPVTDFAGRPLDFSVGDGLARNKGILGAPPTLHRRLLRAAAAL